MTEFDKIIAASYDESEHKDLKIVAESEARKKRIEDAKKREGYIHPLGYNYLYYQAQMYLKKKREEDESE